MSGCRRRLRSYRLQLGSLVGAVFIGQFLDFRWRILDAGIDLWLVGLKAPQELAITASGLRNVFQIAESLELLFEGEAHKRYQKSLVA